MPSAVSKTKPPSERTIAHRRMRSGKADDGRRKKRRVLRTVVNLNLTPMIDIIFNLLIFFVVGTRFAEVEGVLRSELPAAPSTGAEAAIPLLPIRVRLAVPVDLPEGCLIRIDNITERPQTFYDLTQLLVEMKGEFYAYDAETPVVIIAGNDVYWQHVVNAFNAARKAKYNNIHFGE